MVQHEAGIAARAVDGVIIKSAMLADSIEPREKSGVFGMAMGGFFDTDSAHEFLQAPITLHKSDALIPQSPQLVDICFFLIHLRLR